MGFLKTYRQGVLTFFTVGLLLSGCGGSQDEFVISSSGNAVDSVAQGRQVVAQRETPSVVAAIDALPLSESRLIYVNTSLWNDNQPDLTGSLAEACDSLAAIVDSAEFGAGTLYQILSRLIDNGQAVVTTFGRSLSPQVSDGLARCRDCLVAIAAPQSESHRNSEVTGLLNPAINSVTKFHAVRTLPAASLPPQQRAVFKQLRDSLTPPSEGDAIHKVIKLQDMQKYLDGTYDLKVFGFQAVYSDVDNLSTASELIEGLRLDYPGGFQGESTVAALIWVKDASSLLNIPYGPANGGNQMGDYPFTGNGFTATRQANAIPEWVLPPSGASLQDGAQLFTIDDQGQRTLQATLRNGSWVMSNNRETPAARRQAVELAATYRGAPVYLISKDEQFYYANATSDLGLLEQSQLGMAEYRGKIATDDPELVLL